MREDTIAWIRKNKIIAIVRGQKPEDMLNLAKAFLAGGINMMEVTFNQKDPASFSQTAESIRLLNEHFGKEICVGAGTVMNAEQVRLACEAGAQYIISPGFSEEVVKETRKLNLVSMPGALSPSEIQAAYEAGGDFIKVFPAGNLGSKYIKAIKAPLSHIPVMAVGGISEKNAAEFLQAGAEGLGVGGALVNKEWIAGGEWDKITALAAEYRKAVG